MKQKIQQFSQSLSEGGARQIKVRPYLLPLVGAILGVVIVVIVVTLQGTRPTIGSNSRIVNLSIGGKKQVVASRAVNVGQLLNNLHTTLYPQDVVEPSLDTPILEDNFRVNIYRARPVTVVDGANKSVALTAQKSPRVVAQAAGVSLYPEDKVTFEAATLSEGVIGEKVVIARSVPVLFNLYGTSQNVRTNALTVGELLQEKGVKLTGGDHVQPAAETQINPDMQVFVLRAGAQLTTVEEAVAAPVQYIEDGSLSFGTTVTRQAGSPGKKLVTYQIDLQNGKEISRQVIQEAVVTPAVPHIVARGKAVDIPVDKEAVMASAGIASSDYGYVNYIISRESGWCATKWQGEYGGCPAYHGAPSSGGYGLCQATPPGKMASAGSDWASNPNTQLRWCSGYARDRYGSWSAAYNHWVNYYSW